MKEEFKPDELKKIKLNREEEKEFRKNLKKTIAGDKHIINSRIYVGKSPNSIAVSTRYGELGLFISKSVIDKCMRPLVVGGDGRRYKFSGHFLSEIQIRDSIWAIKNPILVMKGALDDTLAIMTNLFDDNNCYIFVYIGLNQKNGFERANLITSIYGKEDVKEYIEKNIEEGNIIAINKNKADEMRRSIGVDFPEETSYINFDYRIAYSMEYVNNIDK